MNTVRRFRHFFILFALLLGLVVFIKVESSETASAAPAGCEFEFESSISGSSFTDENVGDFSCSETTTIYYGVCDTGPALDDLFSLTVSPGTNVTAATNVISGANEVVNPGHADVTPGTLSALLSSVSIPDGSATYYVAGSPSLSSLTTMLQANCGSDFTLPDPDTGSDGDDAVGDTDGDNIPDYADACPEVAGIAAHDGCPICEATVTFGTSDPAPMNGEVRLYTNFGYDYLRPEGYLAAAFPAVEGQATWGTVEGLPCGIHIRAWLFDTADNVQGFIPSQYFETGVFVPFYDDYGVSGGIHDPLVDDETPIYAGAFGNMLAAEQANISEYDPFVPDFGTRLIKNDMGDGLVEWGLWDEGGNYVLFGWTQTNADGTMTAIAYEGGPLDQATFEQVAAYHRDE